MSNRRYAFCLRAFIIASAVSFIPWGLGQRLPEAKADEQSLAEKARAVLSQATGRAVDELTVVKQAPLASTGIRRFKVLDSQGNIHSVNLDDSGNPVSHEEVQRAAKDISDRGFGGKLEAELTDRLSAHDETNLVNVVFWLKGEEAPTQPLRHQGLSEGERRSHLDTVRDQIAAIQQPVVDYLRAMGQQVIYQARYAPAVVAAASASAIWEMEARDDIERIYLERISKPRLNVSRVVVQAHEVNNRDITGEGVTVGIVEPGRIARHPNLPEAQRVLCRPEASDRVIDHKTLIAGVIQSTHKPLTGVAPGITLVDGIIRDGSDAEIMAATDCVINKGATAINFSFGEDSKGRFGPLARFVDTTAYRTHVTFVVAVANSCNVRIGNPDIAFNAIAVGQFWDGDTTGFENDIMSCQRGRRSAFLDPLSPHGDREEPDLVAPGSPITSTDIDNDFATTGGTSLAAPFVTGGVGLLEQRGGATGPVPTELARAILMASARHNLEGASRLSEKDGAGGIMLAAADAVLGDNDTNFLIDQPGGAEGFPDRRIFKAFADQRVRVVLAWLHKSPLGDAMDEPTTDLDLTVFGHFPFFDDTIRLLQGFSVSFDNNYEIVEFIAPLEGTYSAEILNFRSSPGQEFIGLAVSRTDR
jgi:subtilisin family serine protease